MLQFFRGGGDVGFDGVEHPDRIQRSEAGSQNGKPKLFLPQMDTDFHR
jgi:hypothetical protein